MKMQIRSRKVKNKKSVRKMIVTVAYCDNAPNTLNFSSGNLFFIISHINIICVALPGS